MLYRILCLALFLLQANVAFCVEPHSDDVQEFIECLQNKLEGILTDKRATHLCAAIEKILSESQMSPEARKLMLRDAKEYIKTNDLSKFDKGQFEEFMFSIEDMFFYSANFPKNKDEQTLVLNQIQQIYQRAESSVGNILKSKGYEEFLAPMRKRFKTEYEFAKSSAQNRFYPAYSHSVVPEILENILEDLKENISNCINEEPKMQIATLKQKRLYLIEVPISEFSNNLLRSFGFPQIHPVSIKKKFDKINEKKERNEELTTHPLAVAFYLISKYSPQKD